MSPSSFFLDNTHRRMPSLVSRRERGRRLRRADAVARRMAWEYLKLQRCVAPALNIEITAASGIRPSRP